VEKKSTLLKKISTRTVLIIVLVILLCITSFAIILANADVESNIFRTGIISVNLNDGKPVIQANEFVFQPGLSVERDFFIENTGSWDVYYRIYLENVSGDLYDVLQITLRDDDEVLYRGYARDFTRDNVIVTDNALKKGEKRILNMEFHYPQENTNKWDDLTLAFNLRADVVQMKNNDQKEFQ
jgi:hypothetical protein